MAFEKELRNNQENMDDFWARKLKSERERLEEVRNQQEQELQNVI